MASFDSSPRRRCGGGAVTPATGRSLAGPTSAVVCASVTVGAGGWAGALCSETRMRDGDARVDFSTVGCGAGLRHAEVITPTRRTARAVPEHIVSEAIKDWAPSKAPAHECAKLGYNRVQFDEGAMQKISSATTAFHKRVFPIFWFGSLAIVALTAIAKSNVGKANLIFLIIPCVMGVFGYFLMKNLVWDLVDEVYDCGDFLLIKNRGQERRVSLADIINVSSSEMINPPRITLRIANPIGPPGRELEVTFSPKRPFTLNPFAKNPIAEDLIVRVDRARSIRASTARSAS
jgi:hypothetical protein